MCLYTAFIHIHVRVTESKAKLMVINKKTVIVLKVSENEVFAELKQTEAVINLNQAILLEFNTTGVLNGLCS